MRVTYLHRVRIALRFSPRPWPGGAPRVAAVFRVDDAGNLEELPIELISGAASPWVRVDDVTWTTVADLANGEFTEWTPEPRKDADGAGDWHGLSNFLDP
jgi:hypothetical protein